MKTPEQPSAMASVEPEGRPRARVHRRAAGAGAVDDDFGRSESIDPDDVGDIADEGAGHRG